MEDRHFFSEPRPVRGLKLPTWEVDVFRTGVPEAVLTLRIDETTLPPRMRKRKIAWKLPDSIDVKPNFGADEKRRLLDLFKQEKKLRRKSSRRNSATEKSDVIEEVSKTAKSTATNMNKEKEEDQPSPPPPPVEKVEVKLPPAKEDRVENESPPPSVTESSLEDSSAEVPTPPSGQYSPPKQPQNGSTPAGTTVSVQKTQPVSPLLRQRSAGTAPPPGFEMSSLTLSEPPNRPPVRYFNVPSTSGSIPVELAKSFMDMYYPCITHGQQDELLMHFSPEAQKSLSVGGAHAFCDSRQAILQQLNSLQGSFWDVRGVVAQPSFMGSVVILINGMTLPLNQPQTLLFSHSITLIRSDRGYQIYNDAMSLISNER